MNKYSIKQLILNKNLKKLKKIKKVDYLMFPSVWT